MLTIPGQRSQSMLGRTKADLQPIGSTLLTACNLLMSLVRPHRAGVRANRRVCPPSALWCKAAFFPLKVSALLYFHCCCCCTCLPAGTHGQSQSLATVNFSLASLLHIVNRRRFGDVKPIAGALTLWLALCQKTVQHFEGMWCECCNLTVLREKDGVFLVVVAGRNP